MTRYRVIVREGPRVRRENYGDLQSALDAVERAGRSIEARADAGAVDPPLIRRFEPAERVLARLELGGPGLRGGVDVRGDGSSEAYTGRLRRRVVERRPGESAYDALRRAAAS